MESTRTKRDSLPRTSVGQVAACDVRRGAVRIQCITSVVAAEVAAAAEDRKYVRLHVYVGGYLFERLGPFLTKVTALVMLDPKGSVPLSIVNFVALDRPMGLARARLIPDIADRATWPAPALAVSSRSSSQRERVAAVANAGLLELVACATQPEAMGWEKARPRGDVEVWFRRAVNGSVYVLTRGVVDAPLEAVDAALADPRSKKALNTQLDRTAVFAEFPNEDDVPVSPAPGHFHFAYTSPLRCQHLMYRKILMTAKRDAVVVSACAADAQLPARVRWTKSIDAPDHAPLADDYVRTTVHVSGFYLAPNPSHPRQTLLTAVNMIDLGGALPSALLGKFAQERARSVEKVRALPLLADPTAWPRTTHTAAR